MAPAGIGDRVEGFHAVAAALTAGRVERLVIDGSIQAAVQLTEQAEAAGAAIEVVDDVRPQAVTDAPQGVLAWCRPIPTLALDELAARARPIALVVLDHLEDPANAGAIARSAVAAGFHGLVVSGRRAAPLAATAFKAAAGALERLPVAVVGSIPDAMARLGHSGVWTVGLDAAGEESIFGLELLEAPVALVVGAEGAGLSRLVRERADVRASIPLAGGVESLNASVAAAIAMFEVMRQRAAR